MKLKVVLSLLVFSLQSMAGVITLNEKDSQTDKRSIQSFVGSDNKVYFAMCPTKNLVESCEQVGSTGFTPLEIKKKMKSERNHMWGEGAATVALAIPGAILGVAMIGAMPEIYFMVKYRIQYCGLHIRP